MAYTIGQASAKLNISIDTIRYYDKQGLLPSFREPRMGAAPLPKMICT
ncbi:MerR family DNA-binding transcriptional regulator [Limosilactobacillus fermentum]